MGIRFACPNGHRLNVKSYLAGKRGICPHCGIRFDIPLESWPDFENRDKRPSDVTDVQTTSPAPPAGRDSPALPARSDQAASPARPHHPPTEMSVDVPPAEPLAAKLASSQSTESDVVPTSHGAASSTADGQEWFVQTPDGNRYGPADDQTMREWIAEGRLAPDNLVHQRGWPTWKTAATVFAELDQEAADQLDPATDLVVESTPRVRRSRSRQQAKPRLVALIATLGITSVVLLGALIYVIRRS